MTCESGRLFRKPFRACRPVVTTAPGEKHMRPISLLTALAVALAIGLGTTPSFALDATLDVYYWSYAEEVPGNDDFVDEYSDPVFVSIGLRDWDTFYDVIEPIYTVELGGGPATYAGSGTLDGYFYYKFRGEIYAAHRFDRFSPFIGLGYRWLYDDSGGKTTSTGFLSYDRQSQYFYLPVGTLLQITDGFRIKAQFNWLLFGRQDSYLSDISGFSDVKNDQNSGWGVDTTLDYRLTEHWGVHAFFRYWSIEDSEVAVGFVSGGAAFTALEPKNTTVESGLGVSYRF